VKCAARRKQKKKKKTERNEREKLCGLNIPWELREVAKKKGGGEKGCGTQKKKAKLTFK